MSWMFPSARCYASAHASSIVIHLMSEHCMQAHEPETIAAELRSAANDLTRFMSVIGRRSGEWVEMRHFPPIDELDGWRRRDDFVAYLMREAEFFPRTFESVKVSAAPFAAADHVVIDPLSFSGTLLGQDRVVDIRYRLTLHYDAQGRLSKITGALTPENKRDDVIAWLKVIDQLGGLGQTRAQQHPPAKTS
jgi:hypothetical protein